MGCSGQTRVPSGEADRLPNTGTNQAIIYRPREVKRRTLAGVRWEWEWISLGMGSRIDFVDELRLVRMGTGGISRTERDQEYSARQMELGGISASVWKPSAAESS